MYYKSLIILILISLGHCKLKQHCNKLNEECVDYEIGDVDPSLNDLEQDDPKLIQVLRDYYIMKPSQFTYSFERPTTYSFLGVS